MKKYEPIFIKGSIDLTLKKAIFDIVKLILLYLKIRWY